jgi:hypothetical protein
VANYAPAVVNYVDALNAVTFPNVDRNKIYDQFFDTKPFFALLRTTGHLREIRGGLFHQRTINVGKSPNATWYTGQGGWQMSTFEGLIAFGWDWKFAHDGVVVTGEQIVKNEYSDDAIVELIQGKVDIASLTLPDLVGNDVWRNNPYGTSSDNTAGNPSSIEGCAVQVDDGTISTTVGQQSRTTFPVLKSKANYNNALGSTFINSIQALWSSANRGGVSRTKINFTTELIYNSYWGSLQTPERYVIDPRRLEAIGIKTTGGNDLAFNDAVVLIDEGLPSGVPKPVNAGGSGGYWYGLNTDFFEFVVHPDRFFSMGEWYKDPYGDQYFMDIYLACALLCLRPNRQFVTWVSGG